MRHSFANHYFTSQGGTHDAGLRNGVAAGLRDVLSEHLTDASAFEGEDLRAGLTAVVSVWLREPYFEGATRSRLNNPEVESAVKDAMRRGVYEYFVANRAVAEAVVAAWDDREAAKAQRKERR